MKRLTTLFSGVLLTLVCAQDAPLEFDFNQSSSQAFLFINSAIINGVELEENDWVAAFNEDICVGSREWNIAECGGLCDIPLMGEDAMEYSQGYMQSGDEPTFRIYDSSEEIIFDAIPNINFPWAVNQFFQIDSLVAQVYGCTDQNACNYFSLANIENETCEYPEVNYDCDGECLLTIDCFGICGGDAEDVGCGCGEAEPSGCDNLCGSISTVDECGICNGDGILEGDCDCDGTLPEANYDCDGECINDSDTDGVCDEDELATNDVELPSKIGITSIYPNPFNPQTTIEYGIDSYSYVRVNIYNLNGVLVESLIDTYQPPGYY